MPNICHCGTCQRCRQRACMRRLRAARKLAEEQERIAERERIRPLLEGRVFPYPLPSMFGMIFDRW